jgi:hypothetical protein
MGISGADEDTSDKLARAETSWRQMRINLEDRKNLGEGWNLLKPVQIKTGQKNMTTNLPGAIQYGAVIY